MALHTVSLLETVYPCWAYALARVGKKDLLTWEWINKEMQNEYLDDYGKYKNGLFIGDILVWRNPKEEQGHFYCPVTISHNIIWEKISYCYHACVFEGNGLITDMVKTDGNFELPFIIRMRRLSDLSEPDFVIRFTEQE